MRDLRMQWSRALNLVCEVTLSLQKKNQEFKKVAFSLANVLLTYSSLFTQLLFALRALILRAIFYWVYKAYVVS